MKTVDLPMPTQKYNRYVPFLSNNEKRVAIVEIPAVSKEDKKNVKITYSFSVFNIDGQPLESPCRFDSLQDAPLVPSVPGWEMRGLVK